MVVALSILFPACSVLTPVRALKTGEQQINLSLGGPWVPSSLPTIVVPYTTAGYARGITDDITISGNLHIIAAVFKTAGIDAGGVYKLSAQQGLLPELTIYPKFYYFKALRSGAERLYGSLSANASYQLQNRTLLYAGADYMDTYFTPFIGGSLPVSEHMALQLECKWMACNADTRHGIFEGDGSIGGKGAFGLFIGANYAL